METTQIQILDAQTDVLLYSLSNRSENNVIYDDSHFQKLQNNEESFDFKTVPESDAVPFLRERNRLIITVEGGIYREFIIDEVIQDFDKVEVYSTASHLELKRAKPMAPRVIEGETLNTSMDIVLAGTGWQRGETDFSTTATIEFDTYRTPFEALHELATLFDMELVFRIETSGSTVTGRYVDAVRRVGAFTGRELNSGRDLIDAVRRENTENIVTALVGLGPENNGTRIVVEVTNEDARQVWGRNGQHLWDVYEVQSDNQELTEAQVRSFTEQALQARISAAVEYSISGVDLEYILGMEHETIRLGDSVRIKATEYEPPLYLDARVIAIETSLTDPSEKTYTLGEFIEYAEEDILALRQILLREIAKIDLEGVFYGVEPPTDTSKLWIYTGQIPNVIYRYDEATADWVKATPTEASEVGAETPEGAQEKAELEKYAGQLTQVSKERAQREGTYTKLIQNTGLRTQSAIDGLNASFDDYMLRYNNLVFAISNALADESITQVERDELELLSEQYRLATMMLAEAEMVALEDITKNRSKDAKDAAEGFTRGFSQKKVTQSPEPPADPDVDELWLDTTTTPGVLKRWNGTQWSKEVITDFSEMDGEVQSIQIEENAITRAKLAPNAVGTDEIEVGAITEQKMKWSTHLIF